MRVGVLGGDGTLVERRGGRVGQRTLRSRRGLLLNNIGGRIWCLNQLVHVIVLDTLQVNGTMVCTSRLLLLLDLLDTCELRLRVLGRVV